MKKPKPVLMDPVKIVDDYLEQGKS